MEVTSPPPHSHGKYFAATPGNPVSPGRSLGPCAELLLITCFILQMFEATAISMPVLKMNMRMKYTRFMG
ncbi:hypothetical protein EYF80_039699 [Liparis tanakae]|uniref:Uncharacterized protein n=1 Tax=Liparis tanakae TaxID=230148 RepID=A0A4Z2GAW7_9TELE|nr:hypothetical protein EYF80_039699 [Liparis tanakae]